MNLTTKCKFYKKGVFDLNNRLYELSADLSHDFTMGRLDEYNFDWLKAEIEELYDLTSDLLRI